MTNFTYAQRKKKKGDAPKPPAKKEASFVSTMKLRNVGPSFCSGRIADIAVHPNDENHWYVAVGSGGVWETKNAGITWKPIFDNYSVYSTGCITIDSNNPSTIWLGTGENVGGRHVGYGDGLYRSTDGGKSWKNMGLKKSEHLSEIIVHPDNSNVIFVAAQGPLWSKGGERGLYKSTDGGQNWKQVLGDNEWVGVTDIAMDPRDPNLMYAATWQRHRTVATYMGGGPGTAIYRSRDGGENWEKLSNGIPRSNLGKIGIAISPQQPDVIYAAIELDRRKGGVYKSTDQGSSWTKMSSTVSGGTGPHYYQELYACPHNFDRIYLMDVRIQVSNDGGKTFRRLKENKKHSDNHAIVFRADDPDYLLIGTDGGIYESYDLADNWRFIDNLPLTQYYKVAVDDRKPFYHIYGGTQDNGSHGGPSRTDDWSGIRNADWYKTLGADGHQSATEPGNPDIIYAETQQGGMHRIDLKTGEQVYIQPQPLEGDVYERFNWDAPIIVSPHDPATIFFASQRVWKSTNRGDSWVALSDDLTRNENRIELEIMGKKQSWENPWDNYAMSNYNSITSLSQSPIDPNIMYAGTDDGIIQATTDGGKTWKKIMASTMGLPSRAFVNDIKADLHDANTVYVALDNHKEGDFNPYLFKSTNNGQTWTSIKANIPERTLVWRIVQDHIDKDLLFLATEFGIYTSLNGGGKWEKIKGAPTISFR
ncbi:MAG: glycosyl hydrolase, partial [Bacteroidota bacterium]